ncbi:hypothetical protein PR048_011278 [Dryococelus australis]|uniref:Uncharacterized protein n=1 Tax=Dryococelus australis TaxID=614101 RepID=A0ABQ9HLG6_9NEOP|nr:hypothetical protein PR048_011278 [Dryococelus australis]
MMALNQLDVHLKYGSMKPGTNGKNTHILELSLPSHTKLCRYIIFNLLDVGKYEDITIGYCKVHFKCLGLSVLVESCNDLEHWVCYNNEYEYD